MTEFAVIVCLCVYLPDDHLVEVERCMKNMSHNRLLLIDCAVCWNVYSTLLFFFRSQSPVTLHAVHIVTVVP
jgi:hypothetical protein